MLALATLFLLPLFTVSNARFVPKIVDGNDAELGEIPYQVSLQNKDSGHHFCGGSILNTYYVITAAHCVQTRSAEIIAVIAGTVNLLEPHSRHMAVKTYAHEKYNREDSWVNDIALIKVQEPFIKSDLISFVPLPQPGDIAKPHDIAVVSGFGRLWHDGPRTTQLHWVNIIIADQDYCKSMYPDRNIRDTHLCANDPTTMKGSCKGDSGGPLMVNGKLAGLVSWSKSCANTEYPSVYTRVSSYLDWIKEHAV